MKKKEFYNVGTRLTKYHSLKNMKVIDYKTFYSWYHILASIVRSFLIENDAEIFPAHFTWKVAEKVFKMAFMMNKLARISSCEITLQK
jgi:hypothetical protein